MTMITPSYLGETIEYSSLHACRSTLEDPTLPYLHFPKTHQRWLRPFLAFARDDAAGRSLAEWARDTYDPARLQTWLEANGHAGTFKGIFEKPVASKWQW